MNFVIVDTVDEVLKTTLVEQKKPTAQTAKLKKIGNSKSGNSKGAGNKTAGKIKISTTRNATLSNRRVKASQRSKRKV
jgi:hypothetical protein